MLGTKKGERSRVDFDCSCVVEEPSGVLGGEAAKENQKEEKGRGTQPTL